MTEFRMPSLGADMEKGTLLTWRVHPGDVVHTGDIVAEVDTAKAAIEVECFDDGTIGELLVPEGATVPVGTVLATIEPNGADANASAKPMSVESIAAQAGAAQPFAVESGAVTAAAAESASVESTVMEAAAAQPVSAEPVPPESSAAQPPLGADKPRSRARSKVKRARRSADKSTKTGGRRAATLASAGSDVHATPLVRRLAQEAGIDLAAVQGSGPDGRIVRADVERVIAARREATRAAETKTAGTQRITAPNVGDSATRSVGARPVSSSGGAAAGAVGVPPASQPRGAGVAPETGGARPTIVSSIEDSAAEAVGVQPVTRSVAGVVSGRVRASGYARRLARELGVDLSVVCGGAPGGAVRAADVLAAQAIAGHEPAAKITGNEQVSPTGAVRQREPAQVTSPQHDPAAMRRAIAAAMTRSKQTIPHYYLSTTIDVATASDWLREVNKAAPVPDRIVLAALLLRAVALAARTVPAMNGHWIEDTFHPAEAVDLGMIVSLRGGGIIAPTLAHADTTPLPELMVRLREAVTRARSGRLRSSDTAPASITVTNLGELGVESVIGVIPPPQVAIVGFGAVIERPCAVGGLLGVRPQVTTTLAADHRASDGAVGARFLNTIAELLQHPEQQ
ncbi:2-oxo acid dehydrogenase subunit E2 [Nocardia vinacea]|uniref:2-oxo acid dehydrogenase subunit E2 n=1 Tax=Nocardia vinacea TaxID=96468 RepID=UPI0033EBA711